MEIYLDSAATTAPHPQVVQAVTSALGDAYANPSSIHRPGRRARRLVEESREAVAEAIGAKAREIVFTSGATEADNLAVRGLLANLPGALLTSPLEHSAVLSVARELERTGRRVLYASPSAYGEIEVDSLRGHLDDSVSLVALMLVNNETGVRTRIEEIAPLVHAAGALLFCDAVQGFGFEEIDVNSLGADAVAISGHKAYGPKGVGALWIRDGVDLARTTYGGEQERGLRPGTHNTPAIAGLGAAARLARDGAAGHGADVARRRDRFEALLEGVEGLTINGRGAPRGPKHCSVSVAGVDGETLLMSLDGAGVYASAGSACSAGSIEPSHVLTAMGLDAGAAKATIRFSFDGGVDEEQVSQAAETFLATIERCRAVAV
jgi:cysteine desulfurase